MQKYGKCRNEARTADRILPGILSLERFANAKLLKLSYAVHRDYIILRKAVPCRYKQADQC